MTLFLAHTSMNVSSLLERVTAQMMLDTSELALVKCSTCRAHSGLVCIRCSTLTSSSLVIACYGYLLIKIVQGYCVLLWQVLEVHSKFLLTQFGQCSPSEEAPACHTMRTSQFGQSSASLSAL